MFSRKQQEQQELEDFEYSLRYGSVFAGNQDGPDPDDTVYDANDECLKNNPNSIYDEW